jgi:hypothetical protein
MYRRGLPMRKPAASSNALIGASWLSLVNWITSPWPKNEERLARQGPDKTSPFPNVRRAWKCSLLELIMNCDPK